MPEWKTYDRYNDLTNCAHEITTPTLFTKSNGVVCVYLQCVDCGERTKEARKSDYDVSKLPDFDESFRDEVREKNKRIRKQLSDQWQAELVQEQQTQNAEWWTNYNAYLNSPHWSKIRRLVLRRDNWRCQACFQPTEEKTAHVHHLSYDGYNRLGISFAFECVTLCKPCHQQYHGQGK